ncbi:ASCH domain-containing protein [Chitinibacter sp. SCUT-21]|uniref:ASCH domain-containing protein n=1 Tax=Chitinibacter sp. SCUT-21 TaxID=2970891 RepID=UPI0035A6B200
MNTQQQEFLNQYLRTLSPIERAAIPQCVAEHFCADEYNANECARLINEGIKTATCSLKAAYDIDDEPLPAIGRLSVVLNWAQEPVCIVKLVDVAICPFNQVSSDFAALEGEGDRSYASWYQAHREFFTHFAASIGVAFTEQSDLVLERFEKVFPL